MSQPDRSIPDPQPSRLEGLGPARWLTWFGPGAILASLTIGAGELVFSSRAGALFGYRLLWFFLAVLAVKWVLVFAAARHMVLSGAHPFERWMELPGPRGWLPMVFLALAIPSFPIWVGFHAGTVGTLVARLTSTATWMGGSAHLIWGILVLGAVSLLIFTGGYRLLERIQIGVVLLLLLCVIVSLVLIHPDWVGLLQGCLIPSLAGYPDWALALPEFEQRPVGLEVITYVGVLGGSAYDYLAYVSYLREKKWGQAGSATLTRLELDRIAKQPTHAYRAWLWAPRVDCSLSFLAVLLFSAVFVACGAEVLAPRQQVPAGADLLSLQAGFVTPRFPWLRHVYFAGALLAMLGTLYGTIEVAPAVIRELRRARGGSVPFFGGIRLRRRVLSGVIGGGGLVLLGGWAYARIGGQGTPPALVTILTPANLFTGVLGCGLLLLLNVWMDRRFLPGPLRMNVILTGMSLFGGFGLVTLGFRGYWEHGGWTAIALLGGTTAVGVLLACACRPGKGPEPDTDPENQ